MYSLFPMFFPLNISFFVFSFGGVHNSTQEGEVLGQLESHFSFSTLWNSGIEFRSSSSVASTFTNRAYLVTNSALTGPFGV